MKRVDIILGVFTIQEKCCVCKILIEFLYCIILVE